MCDANKYKRDHTRTMTHLGMTRVNDRGTYVADTRGNRETWHYNDQIFVYGVDAEMVDQIDKLHDGHDILHESNHSILIFKIRNALPKLRIKTITLPETDEKREDFKNKISHYIASGSGSKINILYDAVAQASKDLKLIRTHKGFRKLKFYWNQDD